MSDDSLRGGEPEPTRRLVHSARAGDLASFSALYERLAPALHTWVDLRLRPGLRGRVEPADVVQEVWCRAWRSLPRLEESTPFRAWIFRIAKNVLLEVLRFAQGEDGGKPGPGPSTRLFTLENLPDDATAISARVAKNEELRAFAEMVRQLDEEERALVVQCGLEGLSQREVAGRLGISVDALAKRWQRLRTRLASEGLPTSLLVDESA